MATIRVKRSTLSAAPTGLTFGEPAFVDGINSFYVTKNNGTSLRVGAEVDTDETLASNSSNKIATQRAVKTYVDGIVSGGAGLVSALNGITGSITIVPGTAISVSAANKIITINNTGVTSINGLTGAVTYVARTNTTNTFTPLQTFDAGIQSTGATFSSGLITVQRGIGVAGDSAIVRVVGSDVSDNLYSSDIRANAAATANTTHTLPATTGTLLNTNSAYVSGITGTANQITASASTGSVTLSLPSTVTVPGALNVTTNLTVTGNLTVNGSTTTVNSDTMTIDDPMITLGTSGGVPIAASDGGKDRGIVFNYYNAGGRTGFFGFDSSANEFVALLNATITSDVVTSVTDYLDIHAKDILVHDNQSDGNAYYGRLTTDNNLTATRTYTLPDHTGVVILPTNLGTSNYILKSTGIGSQPTWIDSTVAGFTAYASTRLATARTIGLTGDISGSASFDGSSNIDITATIAPNSIALGTDTTGNYVATLSTSSTGLSVANSGSESAAVTVNFSTITSGLNMGTFSFATGEFTNSSGTVSIGTVDGGTFT
jgi:hypothetical protein